MGLTNIQNYLSKLLRDIDEIYSDYFVFFVSSTPTANVEYMHSYILTRTIYENILYIEYNDKNKDTSENVMLLVPASYDNKYGIKFRVGIITFSKNNINNIKKIQINYFDFNPIDYIDYYNKVENYNISTLINRISFNFDYWVSFNDVIIEYENKFGLYRKIWENEKITNNNINITDVNSIISNIFNSILDYINELEDHLSQLKQTKRNNNIVRNRLKIYKDWEGNRGFENLYIQHQNIEGKLEITEEIKEILKEIKFFRDYLTTLREKVYFIGDIPNLLILSLFGFWPVFHHLHQLNKKIENIIPTQYKFTLNNQKNIYKNFQLISLNKLSNTILQNKNIQKIFPSLPLKLILKVSNINSNIKYISSTIPSTP